MKSNKLETILIMLALASLIYLLASFQPRKELISTGTDTISFTYSYSYEQNPKGDRITETSDLSLGSYDFVFNAPLFRCSKEGEILESLEFTKGRYSEYDKCWALSDNFDGTNYGFTTQQKTVNVEDWLSITYDPQIFHYRKGSYLIGEGISVPVNYIDDISIDYIFTIKEVSKVLEITADNLGQVSLGGTVNIPIRIKNKFCGGSGGISISDNAVILNQWYTYENIPVEEMGCNKAYLYSIPADKLGRHDVTIKAYFNLPFGLAIETPQSYNLTYYIVKEQISGTAQIETEEEPGIVSYQGQTYTQLNLSNKEATTESTETNCLGSGRQCARPTNTWKTAAIFALITSILGIIYYRMKKK